MRHFGAASSQLSVVGGWQKLEAKSSLLVRSMSMLEATTFPFLHLHCPEQSAADSALMHSLIKVTFGVMKYGEQNSFSGIKSTPLFQTHTPTLLLHSCESYLSRHCYHSPSARLEPATLTGWQNSLVKRGGSIGAVSYQKQEFGGQSVPTAKHFSFS